MCQEYRILYLLVESFISGERRCGNDRSANLSLVETGEREGETQMIRGTDSAGRFDI